jgi:hypothetical protein
MFVSLCDGDVNPVHLNEIGAILAKDDQTGKIVSVKIQGATLTDDVADEIASLSQLRSLVIERSMLNDEIMEKWKNLNSIVEFRLPESFVIRSKSADVIGQFHKLETLDLGANPLMDSQNGDFLQQLTNLKEFHVPIYFNGNHIKQLLSCTKLEELNLLRASRISSSRDLIPLAELKHLRFLTLPMSFHDDDLEEIGKLKQLTHLNLSATMVKGAGFRHIISLSLTSLDLPTLKEEFLVLEPTDEIDALFGDKVAQPDLGLNYLCKLKSLRTLTLNGYTLSKAGRVTLNNCLPSCNIIESEK